KSLCSLLCPYSTLSGKSLLKIATPLYPFFWAENAYERYPADSMDRVSTSSVYAFISWRQIISAGSVFSQSINPLFIAALIPFTLYESILITRKIFNTAKLIMYEEKEQRHSTGMTHFTVTGN